MATNPVPLYSLSPTSPTSSVALGFNCNYISSSFLPQLLPIILPPNWSSTFASLIHSLPSNENNTFN